ncbi:unnamed protein product [Brassica oleracea]
MAKQTTVITGQAASPLFFSQVSPGPGDSKLQFRLVHFWEARKNAKERGSILVGIEMLMIDGQGTVAHGFIAQNHCNRYEKELERGRIYTLTNFFASNIKVMYRVADQKLVICITHTSEMSKVEENIEGILTQRFRIHSFADFEANCDLRGDLHDIVGHLKLVDGQPLQHRPVLCTKYGSTSPKIMVHLQLKELTANPAAASSINPVEVVNVETLTIREISAFIKRQPAKVAYFDCISTIDNVKLGTEWYYIACKDCQTKLNHGPTTLMCPKCCNENATAVTNYRVEMFVYDNEEQCTLIIFGDSGKELTGRKATELIDIYAEENGGEWVEVEVPLPQCFIDTIVQTNKFRIKVAHFNFTSNKVSLTVTKIVSPAVLPPKNHPLNMPVMPISSSQNNPATSEVDGSVVPESSSGGSPYANNHPSSAIDDQKKPKRIMRNG